MTLIDQRIVIDAPPHVVWDHIADPNEVRRWHSGYRNISVLTTQQTGMGTRRRCTPAGGGKDVIEEITAWVEGLGYEYTQIEGGSFREMRARIRLQAGPDGTIVQWTLTYKPRGLVGTLRDVLGGKREMQAMMSESLRQLRRQIDELGMRMDAEYRERVSMRGRLNHDERQEYLSRQGELEPGMIMEEGDAAAAMVQDAMPQPEPAPTPQIAMPPVTDAQVESVSDTVAEPAAESVPLPAEPELIVPPVAAESFDEQGDVPSFVSDLLRDADGADQGDAAEYSHTADTDPKPPEGLREVVDGELAASDDHEAEVKKATQELIHPSVLPSASDQPSDQPQIPQRSLPAGPPVPIRTTPDVAPAYSSKAPTRPLDPDKGKLVDVPGKSEIPQEESREVDAHTRPTPPRGIPAVRSRVMMEPVQVDPDESVSFGTPDQTPVSRKPNATPLFSSAPTPARGIPAVQPSAPKSEKTDTGERERAANLPAPTPKTDTGEMSIWEVFGTQRPSELDANALQDLIESVNAKEAAEFRRQTRWAKRPARVRYIQVAVGLRARMGLQQARVRVHRVRRTSRED